MPQSQSEVEQLKTVNVLDKLPDLPVLSSKSKGWNGIVVEYRHHILPSNWLHLHGEELNTIYLIAFLYLVRYKAVCLKAEGKKQKLSVLHLYENRYNFFN